MEEDEEEEGISMDTMGYHDAAAQNLVSKIRAFPLVTNTNIIDLQGMLMTPL